jgi:hypothetical protein
MLNPIQIEEMYQQMMGHLSDWAHDGIISIDLKFLHENNLLSELQKEHIDTDDLTQYFHVIESVEKVTLFNEQFLIWIVPKSEGEKQMTLVLIALNHPEKPHLEIIFSTTGVYNTPRYVLKVLQHFLTDTLETEATISAIAKGPSA